MTRGRRGRARQRARRSRPRRGTDRRGRDRPRTWTESGTRTAGASAGRTTVGLEHVRALRHPQPPGPSSPRLSAAREQSTLPGQAGQLATERLATTDEITVVGAHGGYKDLVVNGTERRERESLGEETLAGEVEGFGAALATAGATVLLAASGSSGKGPATLNWYVFPEPSGSFQAAATESSQGGTAPTTSRSTPVDTSDQQRVSL